MKFRILFYTLMTLVLVLAGWVVYREHKIQTTCPHPRIVDIGVCSSFNGECAVRYDDGTTGTEYFPILGGKAERAKNCL
jgi:hypothetical protein